MRRLRISIPRLRPAPALAGGLALAALAPSAAAQERPLGTLREQAEMRQEWLEARLTRVLPRLMREQGVELWIVPMREYNEDPVFGALVSPTTMAARRRTVYLFCDRGGDEGVERIAVGGTSQGGLYRVVRHPDAAEGTAGTERRPAEPWGPEQWRLVTPLVEACDPETIAVDVSPEHNFADGLTVGEWEGLREAIPARYRERVVRRPELAIGMLAERVPEMDSAYVEMQRIAHDVIRTAFSRAVVEPGVTTTEDVEWWMRQRLADLGLGTWFHPSVTAQRRGVEMGDSAAPVVLRGDVLHVDSGVSALGLNTDTQHMGYVLREGETEPPAGLVAALRNGQRLQEILLEEMEPGRTGDEVLRRTLARMRDEGIDGSVYTHPIGDHGHGAGPLIGLWDRQEGVPGAGDLPLRPSTWFSIELQATTPVPEWDGQRVTMGLEEEARIAPDGRRSWVLARQERFHLVR